MSNELYLKKEIEQQDAKDQELESSKQDIITFPFKKKVLLGSTSSIGLLANLQFNNLEVGKKYRITFYHQIIWNGNTQAVNQVSIYNNATGTGSRLVRSILGGQHNDNNIVGSSVYEVFEASDTTLVFRLDNSTSCNLQAESYAILEELPLHEETDQWD